SVARRRRLVPAPYHRWQCFGAHDRSLDRALHLPEFANPVHSADCACARGSVHRRGLALVRPRLRSDADGVARALPSKLAGARRQVRRAVSPHVGILATVVRSSVSIQALAALADPVVAARSRGGIGRSALGLGGWGSGHNVLASSPAPEPVLSAQPRAWPDRDTCESRSLDLGSSRRL